MLDALTVAVLGFVGYRLGTIATRAAKSPPIRARWLTIVRGMRIRHFLPVPIVAALVLTVAMLLLEVPGLSFGWWTAIGGTGNVIVGATDPDAAGPAADWLAIVPLVFLTLLFPLLPLLADREERMFRLGAEAWSNWRRVRRAVEFGLIHLIMGIPIAVALALSVGGGYFTLVYLRAVRRHGSAEAGLLDATRAHTAYNALILLVALVGLVGTRQS